MFEMGFLYLCIMAVTYIAGGVAYAIRIPERFFPGKKMNYILCIFFCETRSKKSIEVTE